jgi:hypothetical protein
MAKAVADRKLGQLAIPLTNKREGGRLTRPPSRFARHPGPFSWLGCRDSNPNYLIQSQASYR